VAQRARDCNRRLGFTVSPQERQYGSPAVPEKREKYSAMQWSVPVRPPSPTITVTPGSRSSAQVASKLRRHLRMRGETGGRRDLC